MLAVPSEDAEAHRPSPAGTRGAVLGAPRSRHFQVLKGTLRGGDPIRTGSRGGRRSIQV